MNKKSMPLITVVVPIYNVERYLKECVESIINQTYLNLEIILVDDESPDHCGEICDYYQKIDHRIKVIHQKNRGLSGARNVAIDIAKGEYITFIDSDDYIELDMIEMLYKQICLHHAEMAVCGFESFFEDGTKKMSSFSDKVYVYTREQAFDCFLFNGYLTPCICGKLYCINLWKNIRCPEGKLFEDQFTMYKLIDICNKIVYVSKPKYNYRKRKGSIGHSMFSEKTYDLYTAIQEEYNFVVEKYGAKCPNISVAKITWEIVFVNMMLRGNVKDNVLINKIRTYARSRLFDVFKCPYINVMRKMQIFLFCSNIKLYNIFYMKYKSKYGES